MVAFFGKFFFNIQIFLQEWADIQILLGRHGREKLLREVEKADTVNLDEHTCKRVEQLQKDFTIDDIRSVSNGAATFYLWVSVNYEGNKFYLVKA